MMLQTQRDKASDLVAGADLAELCSVDSDLRALGAEIWISADPDMISRIGKLDRIACEDRRRGVLADLLSDVNARIEDLREDIERSSC